MKRISIVAAALTAAAVWASAASADAVPFPSTTAGPVFVAAQTVTTDAAMTNYFAPGNTVVFRAYAIRTKTKTAVAAKDVRWFYVKIAGQPNVKLAYKPTAPGASAAMPWVGTWAIPTNFAPGKVQIDIRIKLRTHETGQFVQMPVSPAMLTVSATPPATYAPAPTASTGPALQGGKLDLSLYVDTVNGTRPVGTAPRQVGCSQTNVYKRGEQVVFRVWGMDLTSSTLLSNENVKDAHVSLTGQPDLALGWGNHGLVQFWAAAWIVPADYPLGTVVAHVVFTTLSGKTAAFDYALNIIPS